MKKLISALSVGTALFLGNSQAIAQVTNGQIYVCVQKDGSLYIVAPNTSCGSNDTPLVWNAVGPQGPAGP
jgi:hypothetical protein